MTKFKSIEELGKAYGLTDEKIKTIKKIHKLQQDFILENGNREPEPFDNIVFPIIRRVGINGKTLKNEKK
jgi:hypothetical protein